MSLSHSVHLYSHVIILSKRIASVGLERQWTHDYSLQVDGLAVDPGAAVVELYVVNAFIRKNDSLQEVFLNFLKVNRLGTHLFQTVKSSCMYDAEVDI